MFQPGALANDSRLTRASVNPLTSYMYFTAPEDARAGVTVAAPVEGSSSSTFTIANPVGIRTTGARLPGRTPWTARLTSGRSCDSVTLPSQPPPSAPGPVDSAFASAAKLSPPFSRSTIR